jgi:hypothetical protein
MSQKEIDGRGRPPAETSAPQPAASAEAVGGVRGMQQREPAARLQSPAPRAAA